MKLSELAAKVQKLIEDGHGDAVLVHTDTRSGVSERIHMSGMRIVDGSESDDFYADLHIGDKYVSFFEGD